MGWYSHLESKYLEFPEDTEYYEIETDIEEEKE